MSLNSRRWKCVFIFFFFSFFFALRKTGGRGLQRQLVAESGIIPFLSQCCVERDWDTRKKEDGKIERQRLKKLEEQEIKETERRKDRRTDRGTEG